MVNLKLLYSSESLTEANRSLELHELIIDWHLPFLPREGEAFDLDAFLGVKSDDGCVTLWKVELVSWSKNDSGLIQPTIYLANSAI